MKSYWISTTPEGMALELRDIPVPSPKAGQLGVRIRAASLNRGEFIAGHGLHKAGAARPAGFEAAGEVTALGEGVTSFKLGDRVMGRCEGAFAEHGCMEQDETFQVPPSLNWEQAAATTVAYGTVHDMLIGQGHLKAGEWLMVTGISSGVGVASLQVAKALGAKVIGTSGSAGKLERLKPLGLDVALHTRAPDFADAVMKATGGKGVDLAVNTVGGTMFAGIIDVLGFEGRMATVGYVDNVVEAKIDIAALHKKRLQLFGVSNKLRTQAHRVAAKQEFARDLMPYFADGRIAPLIDKVFPFAQMQEAKSFMDGDQHLGKIVVRMD